MEIMGCPVGKVRLPIRSLSEEAKRRLREELAKLGVLDQEPHGW
jgi:dihydrodipicolinate synthase/N-acetylneuraminate lyase